MANVNFTSFSVNTAPSLNAYVVGHFGESVGAEQRWTFGVIVALVAANLSLTSANISNFNTAAAAASPVQSVAGQTGNVNTIPAANVSGLANVATSGNYGDLSGTPTLGTMAAQNANGVAITGGTVTGITDLAVADGGTGASNAAAARTNLGISVVGNTGAYDDLTGKPTIPNAIFFRIAVAGEPNVDANSATDVLTFVEGANMNISTNATAKTITFAATGGGGGGGGLADPGANGIVIRTAENVTTARTVIGGNGVTVANGNGVSDNITVSVANASTSVPGIVQLSNGTQTDAGLAVQASDPRLSDARTPTAHASTHTAADPIRDATASQNGLMTAAFAAKLDGIPANATNNAGTVTSVNANGTTTGLTFSNGPITNAGTLDLAGVLVAAHGGTGRNTHSANAVLIGNGTGAFNNVAPGSNGNVLTSNGTTWISQAPTGGSGGGTKTYAFFTPLDNQPPAANFATLDTRNSIAILDFDDTTEESAIFNGVMPEAASLGSGLIVRIHWMATTATTGNCRWGVAFMVMNATTDNDSDSFDTAAEATTATEGVSGETATTAITITTIDSIVAGDPYRLKVYRDTGDAADTMTGDAEILAVEVRSGA